MSTHVRVLFSSALPGTHALPTSSSRQTGSAGESEVRVMEVMHPRCAGIDVSKNATLFAGYRYLFFKYTRDDFLFDGALNGAVLGARFRF